MNANELARSTSTYMRISIDHSSRTFSSPGRMRGAGLSRTMGVSLLLVVVGLIAFFEGRKAYLDHQVRELCAKDGGVKIFETVTLSAERFNQWGQINFYRPTMGESALGPDYFFKQEITYYRRGNPEMSRSTYEVIRRMDKKLLGKTVIYGRGGGDFPGPWHESSFACPSYDSAGINALLASMFLKTN